MGAETLHIIHSAEPQPPMILGLQLAALIDHVARVDWTLLDQISNECGGSIPIKPLVSPTKAIMQVHVTTFQWDEFFPQAKNNIGVVICPLGSNCSSKCWAWKSTQINWQN